MIAALAGSLILLAALGVAAASAVRTLRFVRDYEDEKAALLRRAREAPRPVPDPALHAEVPAPVRRYLEATRYFQHPELELAVVRQRGAVRLGPGKPWIPLEAEQVYAVEPPGFLWLARARIAPLVRMLARDAFVDGRGSMRIVVGGLYPVADAHGPEIDRGAGLRYWGEILAFPELATSRYLRWSPLDDRSARLDVAQGALDLSATVEFDATGYVSAIHAERYREVDGRSVLTAWSGHFRDWRGFGGRAFPARWSSVWHLPEGDLEVVRLEVLDVTTA